ncbi:MAG: type II secretion system F family protein [Burkholderiales bacterium]|nr:type II secretion system F family protein [Burkholderiales bacterium]
MDVLYLVFLALCFLAVVMLLEGLYLSWNAWRGPEARQLQRRLLALSAANESIAQNPVVHKRLLSKVPFIERLLLLVPRIHTLDRILQQSALDLTVAAFLAAALAAAVLAGGTLLVLDLPAYACVLGAAVAQAAWVGFVLRHRSRRMRQIESQLPDALDLMARAMQAGHAFSSALNLVGAEGPQPVAGEFRTTFDEINYGIPFDRALEHLAHRVASRDLRFFAVAVVIQRETGGNLAEILTSIATLIRERQKLHGSVRVLSAEGRLSAWILSLLPFVLAGVIALINTEFIAILWRDPAGVRLSAFAVALMSVGIWWMWRLVKFRI